MEISGDCNICAQSFTSERRKPVKCPRCEFECCISCLKRQCVNGSDPMCMNPECRSIFPDSFLYDIFPHSYMKNEFKDNRANVLLEREKGLLQPTMTFVERRKIKKELTQELKLLQDEAKRISQRIQQQRTLIYQAERTDNSIELVKQGKQNFIKKCPMNDCRGFLNAQYRCELCKTAVCSKCFEIKTDDNHVCNENNLKTAELLRKDTKSCPNCSEMIHKIEGCDQMYCVSCNTGFSWKTGKIVTGVIHNPHYFEFMRENGGIPRQNGDIPCGGLPHHNVISAKIGNIFNVKEPDMRKFNYLANGQNRKSLISEYGNELIITQLNIMRWAQAAAHFRNNDIPNYDVGTPFNHNLETRMKYLMNEIDEKKLKSSIIRKDNEVKTKTELSQIFTTLATLLEELFRKLVSPETNRIEHIDQFFTEANAVIKYINNCFQNLANRYKIKMPFILVPKIDIDKIQKTTGYLPHLPRILANRSGTIPVKKKTIKTKNISNIDPI